MLCMQATPVACRVHSACLSPGEDLMDDFDRDSGSSLRRKVSSARVPTVQRNHGLQAPSAQAPEATKDGPEQLHQVLDHLQHLAGSTSSSTSKVNGSPDAASQFESAKERLLAACKPQDRWQLLWCGEWEDHKGWSGPAHALFQVWPMAAATAVSDEVRLGYDFWEIGPDWLPTGEKFASGTGEAEDTITVTGADLQQTHPLCWTCCTRVSVTPLSCAVLQSQPAMHAGLAHACISSCSAPCPCS